MEIDDHSLLASFSVESRRRLKAAAQIEQHPSGVTLFGEEDASDCVYLVLSGEVELSKQSPYGHPIILTRIPEGDYLGDMGVLQDCGRCLSARTFGETRLARIPSGPLMEALRAESSPASLEFLGRLADRLRTTNALYVAEVVRKERLELIGQMAGSILHDLRNPMVAVRYAVDVLMERNQRDEEGTRCCRMVDEGIRQMERMTRELLDFSRGKSDLVKEPVAIQDLVDVLVRMNAAYLERNGIQLACRCVRATAAMDRDRMIRALQNLVNNAVDAVGGESGGRIVRIEADRIAGDTIEIRVADNGPGIPEEVRNQIFEPFVTWGKKQGIGLGLVISKSIVEAHGGTISFASEAGRGTTFIIRLPTT